MKSDVIKNELDAASAGWRADELVAREIDRQDVMWGTANERADISNGQLMHAGMAQLDALYARHAGQANAFSEVPSIYPRDWSGFRDYGSDIANLVVAAAFIRQEIKRKLLAGEDTTRTSRNKDTQPFLADQPKTID